MSLNTHGSIPNSDKPLCFPAQQCLRNFKLGITRWIRSILAASSPEMTLVLVPCCYPEQGREPAGRGGAMRSGLCQLPYTSTGLDLHINEATAMERHRKCCQSRAASGGGTEAEAPLGACQLGVSLPHQSAGASRCLRCLQCSSACISEVASARLRRNLFLLHTSYIIQVRICSRTHLHPPILSDPLVRPSCTRIAITIRASIANHSPTSTT